ncbi:MAG: hypothetical protein PWQ08_745 [Clostridiales bacterium]|jgi:uncharacterized SAM-binding protein YcdF (DUF218 family)|nr:hypothetical protein [Clostridiales bacterium]
MKLRELLILLLALFCLLDSIVLTVRHSFSIGLYLLYLLSAGLLLLWKFYPQVTAFCSHGFGFVLKVVFFCGLAFFVFLLGLMGVSSLRKQPASTPRVAIVLGAGLHGQQLTSMLQNRLDVAVQYWQQHPDTTLVVSGGQGPHETIPEAEAMAQYLVAAGVPREKLLLEGASSSTRENFLFTADILLRHGYLLTEPVLYITDGFHCYRAKEYAKCAGFTQAMALPVKTSFWVWPSSVLREALAICAYWAHITVS